MELVRIGEKVISKKKIENIVTEILQLREKGYSQNEVSRELSVDRTFVSRLETMGEIRKGGKIAVIGFPVKNKQELDNALTSMGVDFKLVMSDKERWEFVSEKSGLDLFNSIMEVVAQMHNYDHVIVIGSNKRINVIQAVLDKEVIGVELGDSPIQEDKYVDISKVQEIISTIRE